MIAFKQPDDIKKARLPPHLEQFVTKELKGFLTSYASYNPVDDGHISIITPNDTDARLSTTLGRSWAENCFEGVSYDAEYHVWSTLILNNNQFGIVVIIPDEPWLEAGIRTRIMQLMEGGGCDR
jgi:hypothetical protein